jgi:hypothetical protein
VLAEEEEPFVLESEQKAGTEEALLTQRCTMDMTAIAIAITMRLDVKTAFLYGRALSSLS